MEIRQCGMAVQTCDHQKHATSVLGWLRFERKRLPCSQNGSPSFQISVARCHRQNKEKETKTCHSSMTYSRNYTHHSSPRLRTQSYGWIQLKRGSEINLSLRNVRLSFAEKWIDRQEQWSVHHTGGKKQWIPRKVISTSGLWMDYCAL